MTTAFQSNALQNNAFQIEGGVTKPKVGWMPEWGSGLRHDPEELEQRLKAQREGTFGRRRFDELIAEAEQKAAELKSKPAKAALKRAIEAVQEIAEPDNELGNALEAAVLASKTSSVIRQAQTAYNLAMAALEDEEEEIELLLLH